MQINENEVLNERTREILDYYRGLPERSSQEAIVEMLRFMAASALMCWSRQQRRPGYGIPWYRPYVSGIPV